MTAAVADAGAVPALEACLKRPQPLPVLETGLAVLAELLTCTRVMTESQVLLT